MDWGHPTAEGLAADVRLLVRGTCRDGGTCLLDQRATVHVRADAGGPWRITRETVRARELVARREPQFEDVSARAGLANVHTNATSPEFQLFGAPGESPIGASSGSAVGDVDGDARVDLFVGALAGGDRLFRNTGGGRFEDATARAGLPAGRWTSMATAADYDRDGDVDLYLVRMGDHERTVPAPNFDAANGVAATLLRNRGDGTFEDATRAAGVAFGGWGLAAAWGDYDDDGWPDLYVTNEFGSNALFHNAGDGTVANRARATGTADGGAGMGVAWADGDGDLDLYVSNMHANSGWALFHPAFPLSMPWWARLLRPAFPAEVARRANAIVDGLVRGSTLYRNDGGGRFTDVSDAAGVRDAQWGWGAAFLDYDADGALDLYAVNGFGSGPISDDV